MEENAEKTFSECVAECARILGNLVHSVTEFLNTYAPYIRADFENPKWVHYAVNSKKKRTRKKYHDRIMRTYGG